MVVVLEVIETRFDRCPFVVSMPSREGRDQEGRKYQTRYFKGRALFFKRSKVDHRYTPQ